jgi:hypothetical protein
MLLTSPYNMSAARKMGSRALTPTVQTCFNPGGPNSGKRWSRLDLISLVCMGQSGSKLS